MEDKKVSLEQRARDLLERMDVEGAQQMTAGDVVELAQLFNKVAQLERELTAANVTIGEQRKELDRWEGRPPQRDCNCHSPACSTRPHYYDPKHCTHYQPTGAVSYADMQKQLAAARALAEEACKRYNDVLADQRILRCAFCNQEYPPGTPPSQHETLTQHVMVCASHPMRRVERELAEAKRMTRRRIEAAIEEYASDYVMECDEGTYTPTDDERLLLTDFAHGLLAHVEIDAAVAKEKGK